MHFFFAFFSWLRYEYNPQTASRKGIEDEEVEKIDNCDNNDNDKKKKKKMLAACAIGSHRSLHIMWLIVGK
jgi:hypothetical protein